MAFLVALISYHFQILRRYRDSADENEIPSTVSIKSVEILSGYRHQTSGAEVSEDHYALRTRGSLLPPFVTPVSLLQTTNPCIGHGGINASGGPQLQ
jgi:hypothetical protein